MPSAGATGGGRRLGALLLALALLGGCGMPEAGTPTAHGAALPAAELGCYRELRAIPAATSPAVAREAAEARAREVSARWTHELGGLLAAQPVTVLAREGRPGLLAGRDVWLLAFEARPRPERAGPASPAATPTGPVRAYALVDAADGTVWSTCLAAS